MANFQPLKNYMFYCLDRCIKREQLTGPFLDIGCGIGDVSLHLAKKGWSGTAIDYSSIAIEHARQTLAAFPGVTLHQGALEEFSGQFSTIIMWDVLEHIEDDTAALRKIHSLLAPGGKLLIAVPSNPREWRWDDEFYGHFRRYTHDGVFETMRSVGLQPILCWDFTFPVFWIMRRIYTWIKKPVSADIHNKEERTKESATVNAWDIPVLSFILNHSTPLWKLIYWIQFKFFKNATNSGHEFFVLAERPR